MDQRQQQQSDASRQIESNKHLEGSILDAIRRSSENLGQKLSIFSTQLHDSSHSNWRTSVNTWQSENQEALRGISQELSEATRRSRDNECSRIFLLSLDSSQLHERHANISVAHAQTFNWIFETHMDNTSPWFNFSEWLLDGGSSDHLYWIKGKPGSGKSTLMKYLYHDDRTKENLKKWARGQTLLVASCFFWNAGSFMQKSLKCLVQALLFEVFSQEPSLIASSAPWRWQTLQLGRNSINIPWTTAELLDICYRAAAGSVDSIKFCFFVDGLDEFEGDDTGRCLIINLFTDLCRHAHIKVCVSSRPWVIYEDAFQGRPSLSLQQLTFNDIRAYVQAELGEHPKFNRIRRDNALGCTKLIQGITDKASGVFLWVVLVVRSLLQGLRNEDGLKDLQRRLDLIPADLEAFFEQIMGTIEPFYQEQALGLFQVALAATEELSLLTYSYILEEEPDYALIAEVRPFSRSDITDRYEPTIRRLNSRCKGLLEVHGFCPDETADSRPSVGFFHRTVKDFMRSPTMTEKFKESGHSSGHIYATICNAYLYQIKRVNNHLPIKGPSNPFVPMPYLLGDISSYARTSDRFHGQPPSAILDELDRAISKISEPRLTLVTTHWTDDYMTCYGEENSFLSFALSADWPHYVEERLRKDPRLFRKQGRPLLHRAIAPSEIECFMLLDMPYWENGPHFRIIEQLLGLGADLSETWDDCTAWELYLNCMARQVHERSLILDRWVQTAKSFIKNLTAQGISAIEVSRHVKVQPRDIFLSKLSFEAANDLIKMLDASSEAFRRSQRRALFKLTSPHWCRKNLFRKMYKTRNHK